MERTVTLVDAANQALGECPISVAHRSPGTLHRAFSVYVFTPDRSQILLQRRPTHKLFGGLWANTCCSHPFAGEDVVAAGSRRLREELGIECPLELAGAFAYQAEDPDGRGAEHEYDVLLIGVIDVATTIRADPAQVAEWKWMPVAELRNDVNQTPERYAPWFRLGIAHLFDA